MGGTMVQWGALLSHRSKVPGFNLSFGYCVWSFARSPYVYGGFLWVSFHCPKNMLGGGMAMLKLLVGWMDSAMDWCTIQGDSP